MESNEKKQIPPLEIINGNTLLSTEYPPLQFAIDKLLPQGIFILAGSGKIGKSWLSLDICIAVATGGELWSFKAIHGQCLYMALEDTHPRLKERLLRIQDDNEDLGGLNLSITSRGITDGLVEQIKAFINANPDTRLVVIDTLERIRNSEQDKSMYSCDYRDINKLREVLEGNDITLVLVHHTRKMYDPDPLNTLSGSTGLVGAVDGIWVLEKEKRTEGIGKLTIANRDTEGYCFKVEFSKEECRWHFLGSDEDMDKSADEHLSKLIDTLVDIRFSGTATELVEELKSIDRNFDINVRGIAKKIESIQEQLLEKYSVKYQWERNNKGRVITLYR